MRIHNGLPAGHGLPATSRAHHGPLLRLRGRTRNPYHTRLALVAGRHPSNPQHVDLIIAPLAMCQQLTSSTACAAAASIMGMDGVLRLVVGTAAALNLKAAEALTCSVK